MTKKEIGELLRSLRATHRIASADDITATIDRLILGVETLPKPKDDFPDLSEWHPGSSQIAFVPGDCLISLKAAIKAGARIIIEPGKPED